MMTHKQLVCLINYIRNEAQRYAQYLPCPEHEVIQARRELSTAFGFETHRNGYPKAPEPHPQTVVTSDPEEHLREIEDYEAKGEALESLIQRANTDSGFEHSLLFSAADIRQHWLGLKAIMEPGSLCKDHLAKVGKNNDAK